MKTLRLPADIAPDARYLGVTLMAGGIAAAMLAPGRKEKLGGLTVGLIGLKLWHLGLQASRAAPGAVASVQTTALPRAEQSELIPAD